LGDKNSAWKDGRKAQVLSFDTSPLINAVCN
jgi:hypothetical protein